MNKIQAWFHHHKFVVVGVQHVDAGHDVGIATTIAMFRCRCGGVYTERFLGKWTVDNINGIPSPTTVVSIKTLDNREVADFLTKEVEP